MTSEHEMRGKEAQRDPAIAAAAIDWFVRQQADDMPGEDWLAFSDWLGEDERHAAAFDAVVAADGKLDALDPADLQSAPSAANDDQPSGRWWKLGAPLAATLAAVVIFVAWPRMQAPEFETLATAPGEMHTLQLDDAIRIDVAGATKITYRRGEQPVVQLAHGEAAFYVDSPQPSALQVEVGGLTLRDKGTAFDVIADDFGLRVAVGEGLVGVSSSRFEAEVSAGQRFVLPRGGEPAINDYPAEQVAGWREGQLSFRDAPLELVASDMGRALGAEISVAPALAGRRFTGALTVADDPTDAITRAAALMGAVAVPKDGGWELRPR